MTCPSNSPQFGYPCLRAPGHTDEHANSLWRWENAPFNVLHKLAVNSAYGRDMRTYNFLLRNAPAAVSGYPPIPRKLRIKWRLQGYHSDVAHYFRTLGHAIIGREVCDCDTANDQ